MVSEILHLFTYSFLCPVPDLCSTPLPSNRNVYSGHVGWGILFSRASCFAAVSECLFSIADLFGLGMWVCLWAKLVSHEEICHQHIWGRLGLGHIHKHTAHTHKKLKYWRHMLTFGCCYKNELISYNLSTALTFSIVHIILYKVYILNCLV